MPFFGAASVGTVGGTVSSVNVTGVDFKALPAQEVTVRARTVNLPSSNAGRA